MPAKKVSSTKQKMRYAAYGLLLLALVAAVVLNAGAINRHLHAWKLLPEPERLTELYFTHPNTLPTAYTPGDDQVVQFSVHNLEGHSVAYTYTIEQISQNNNHKLPLASGTFTLDQDEYRDQSVNVTLGDLDRSQIRILILPTNESINYWVKESTI